MQQRQERNAGICLLLFTVLMLFTMVLHPVGGDFQHLLKVKRVIIIAHVIALLSLPFAYIGFWGLAKKLGTQNFFSISSFTFIVFGLIAVMMAATANGLVLPIFIEKYREASAETIHSLQSIMTYNFSVNNAFDYIYTGAFSLSMLFSSVAILQTRKLPAWLAILGIIFSALAVILTLFRPPHNLQVFRMFVLSIVIWIFMVGVLLVKSNKQKSI